MQISTTPTPIFKPSESPKKDEPKSGSLVKGIAGGLVGAAMDTVAMTGVMALETVPFQIKAQGDLWNSDKTVAKKAMISTGLLVGNAVALCLSPLIGLGVGANYGFTQGRDHGFKAAVGSSLGAVNYTKNMMADTLRTSPRKEHEGNGNASQEASVKVRFLTQDPLVMAPVVAEFPKSMFGDNMANDRIAMQDIDPFIPSGRTRANDPAKPDAQGNLLFEPGTKEFQQVQSFVSANQPLNMYEKSLGRKIPWAFEGALGVHPHAGSGFNAFYARQLHSVNYFDGHDVVTGKDIHGSESLEVTSHEVGHAVLDAMKPGLMAWWGGLEAPAFHEAFGDITGILTALHQDSVLDKVVAETGGDLHKPNCVARLGEEMSLGINHTMLHGKMPEDWVMRDANNQLKYQDPATLPEKPSSMDELFREPHSFSRVYSGAFWDVLSAVNGQFRAGGANPKEALVKTRDVMTDLTARALELTPNRLKHLSQAAEAMLAADKRYFGGQYHDTIQKAMVDRNLLSATPNRVNGESSLPKLSYDLSATDLKSADQWLEKNCAQLPSQGVPLKAEATWKNDAGETFLRFGHTQQVDLDEKTVTDMGNSLTLGFDQSGHLFHSQWEPVDAEAVNLARQEIQTWSELGAILQGAPTNRVVGQRTTTGHAPVGFSVPVDERAGDGTPRQKIVRIPVIYN